MYFYVLLHTRGRFYILLTFNHMVLHSLHNIVYTIYE